MTKTADKRITMAFITARPNEKLGTVKERIQKMFNKIESLHYVYVLNGKGKLIGVLSIKDAFGLPPEEKVSNVMKKEIVKVRAHTHQERVAILALQHNINAMPVVDKEDRLLGVVPENEILKIMHEENTEDFLRLVGIHKIKYPSLDIEKIDPITSAKVRIPWLIIGLFGGIVAATIINFFEHAFAKEFILAAFIPLIVYIADAVGTQTETLFVRSLAINPKLNTLKYFLKEVAGSILIGLSLSLLIFLYAYFVLGTLKIGIILLVSLLSTITVAACIGFLMPYTLAKVGSDPAISSGPIGTIVSDVVSIAIYILIAVILLRIL